MNVLDTDITRLERAHARNTIACAHGRASWLGISAVQRWIGGGHAIFAGHWTNLTQAVALGVSGNLDQTAVEKLNHFFVSRLAVPTAHVCDKLTPVVRTLETAGYHQIGQWRILIRHVARERRSPEWVVKEAARGESSSWLHACTKGFRGEARISAEDLEIGGAVARIPQAVRLLATSTDGVVRGTAAFACWSRIAVFFADSTVAEHRQRGVQSSLIHARLARAAELGCRVATAVVLPGSGSERNYLRCGFKPAYSWITLQKPWNTANAAAV